MWKYTVKVDGMMCGMCEAHVNDTVRREFKAKKISSSHSKGETVIITEDELDEDAVLAAINATGYEATSITKEAYKKKGLFGW